MNKRIVITGFNGFVGRHACKEFKSRGFEVVGITNTMRGLDESFDDIVDEVQMCDLEDSKAAKKLTLSGVTAVLNLAGFAANTGGDEERIHRINVGVHVNLYDALKAQGINPRIIAVSSGAVYDADQDMPITEGSRLKDAETARPYEASKISMEQHLNRFIDGGMDIVVARPFNHIGPGQGKNFLVPDLALKILEAQASNHILTPGNLDSERDYTDVRDVVRAYADLIEMPLNHRLYNICSGVSRAGHEILSLLLAEMDPDGSIRVEGVDESLLRKNDPSIITGSAARLHTDTNWTPQIQLEQTIKDFAAWRLAA